MSNRRSKVVTVILACRHNQSHRYHPSVGEWTWCFICNTSQRVTQTSEVIACCENCTVNRKFGNGSDATTFMRDHVERHPTHTGKIITADLALTVIESSGIPANR